VVAIELTDGRGGEVGEEEPYHTKKRNPCLLSIIQYFLWLKPDFTRQMVSGDFLGIFLKSPLRYTVPKTTMTEPKFTIC
jgi:hypothetical protein